MNTSALKKLEIHKELSHIPDNQLDQVKECIETILKESKSAAKSNRSLVGIWEDKEFDRH